MNIITSTLPKLITNGALRSLACRSLSVLPSTSTTTNHPIPPPLLTTPHIDNSWIWQKPQPLRLPLRSTITPLTIIDDLKRVPPLDDPSTSPIDRIDAPTREGSDEIVKRAARLIVIRRKKMKKHKLRKLRKKMRFLWAKLRQRREWRKEKEFQAGLIARCKEAEAFDAKAFVAEKLKQASIKPPPKLKETDEWKEMMRIKELRLYQYPQFKEKIERLKSFLQGNRS